MAESDINKRKYLYVIGDTVPLKFFRGGRALTSVLSRHSTILQEIKNKYGAAVVTVRDYYALKCNDVQIVENNWGQSKIECPLLAVIRTRLLRSDLINLRVYQMSKWKLNLN